MYTRLLLHMLKRGVLEGPFNQSPERGELKTLPSYMVGCYYERVWMSFDGHCSGSLSILTILVRTDKLMSFH